MRVTALAVVFGVSLSVQTSQNASACTAASLDGWGVTKSFDWADTKGNVDAHGFLLVNARNTQKTALVLNGGTPATWTSQFGSVTFHQLAREFPYGGVNEKGLVVEILQHREANPEVSTLPGINEIQWIQYILDGAETLEQAKALSAQVQIQPKFGVHYFVCDAASACAVFEYVTNDKGVDTFEAIDAEQRPLITNDSYARSVNFLARYVGFGGTRKIPTDSSSLSRFVRAAQFAGPVGEGMSASVRAWDGLGTVKNDMTAWQIAYEPRGSKITYRVRDAAKPNGAAEEWLAKREVQFDPNSVDYSCKQPRKMIDLETTGEGGNVTRQMVDYTPEFNVATLNRNDFLSGIRYALLRRAIASYQTKCME